METVTFRISGKPVVNNLLIITVKKEFTKLVPNFESLSILELIHSHDMEKYLHNEEGPALTVCHKNKELDYHEYWIDGIRVNFN